MNAIIEMPTGTYYKYELKDNELIIDRVQSIPVPYNYGYIPNTLAPDGDPLDVFVVSSEPIAHRTKVSIKPIGVFICEDNGVRDDKIYAELVGDQIAYNNFNHPIKNIQKYLDDYKPNFKVIEYQSMDLYEQSLISQTLP